MGRIRKQATIVFDATTTEVLVRKRPERGIKSPFSAVGPLTNIKFARRNMPNDVFDRLAQVSKGAVVLFRDLKYARNIETNMTTYKPDEGMTRTQRETLSRKFRELKGVGLIRSIRGAVKSKELARQFRMPRGTYIINPEMIRCTNHDEAAYLWGQCANEETSDGELSADPSSDES